MVSHIEKKKEALRENRVSTNSEIKEGAIKKIELIVILK